MYVHILLLQKIYMHILKKLICAYLYLVPCMNYDSPRRILFKRKVQNNLELILEKYELVWYVAPNINLRGTLRCQ